jgi:hypothetical protein
VRGSADSADHMRGCSPPTSDSIPIWACMSVVALSDCPGSSTRATPRRRPISRALTHTMGQSQQMSQSSHAQFPLRRHPHLLVDHRRARPFPAGSRLISPSARRWLQIGIGGRIASEFALDCIRPRVRSSEDGEPYSDGRSGFFRLQHGEGAAKLAHEGGHIGASTVSIGQILSLHAYAVVGDI